MQTTRRSTQRLFWGSLLLFAILYASIAFVNHYQFRTYTYDLGAYTNALYDYVHLQWNDSKTFKLAADNLLSDHFDLYLILFAPFSILFGSYTLLILQWLAVLLGGYGIYKYALVRYAHPRRAVYAMIYFFSFFGLFTALAGDYHSNVVAACLLPYFFLSIYKRQFLNSSLWLFVLLIAKENMGLWLSFVCLGLLIDHWKDQKLRYFLLISSLACLLYFYAVIEWVMPAFATETKPYHFKYSVIGNSISEAIQFLIQQPLLAIQWLFVNHTELADADYTKLSLHLTLVSSGLFFLFKKPQYLLMLIPIYFQKLFHDEYMKWSIGFHYCIEFAPILAMGTFAVFEDLKSERWKTRLSLLAIVLALATTIKTMDSSTIYMKRSQIRFYKKDHYQRAYDVAKVHEAFQLIPKTAKVCAQSPFLPHLALRDHIYNFPFIQDADYVVFALEEEEMPFLNSKAEFEELATTLKTSKEWEVVHDDVLTILKKRTTIQHE